MKTTKYIILLMHMIVIIGVIGCKNNSEASTLSQNTNDFTHSTDVINISNETNSVQNYCSLTLAETFSYLTENSPFNLGSSGSVNFTKRFSYERNAWVEKEIHISGGMNSNSRLLGKYQVTNRNTIRVFELRATGGMFDATRNGDTFGSFTINCNGDIEGYLRDYNGNTKDVTFKKDE